MKASISFSLSWKRLLTGLFLFVSHALSGHVMAQTLSFSVPHGFYEEPFIVSIRCDSSLAEGVAIHYTLDGSEPTVGSQVYTQPLDVSGNTLLRAVALTDTGYVTPVATVTYLFVDDVLKQSDAPEGYPAEWGHYTELEGRAIADYGMDTEMAGDAELAPKIAEGLMSLPVLSIVTDREHLFSHQNDSLTGGIYIFTGPPVGDSTGNGWTRPAHVELFGGQMQTAEGTASYDMSASCGLRLHGGHGRLAEKNPKHSFRLVFKKEYGEKTLKYPIFGEDEPAKFDQLVLRCHFGNSWNHWGEWGRKKAQYTRDVWARRMQRKMGHTSINALYVNLFLNGMYWGIYNIAERVDDQYGNSHLGGKKSDIDVVKIEEEGGSHFEASEGNLDAWNMMIETAACAADDACYYKLQGKNAEGEDDPQQEALLDIDAFIDYMLINQYGGNTDWDHHNWYAIRRRGAETQGFKFLCWDTEQIFENNSENVLGLNNGDSYPTGIFNNLMQNESFARQYLKRAKEVFAEDGLLGQKSVVQLWDSLYQVVSSAIYAESARWGDYRRDVHPYQSQGELYTVDNQYMEERNRLLEQYFPYRSERVLSSILGMVHVDDFDAPEGWEKLTAAMFKEWDDTDKDARPVDKTVNVDWNMGYWADGGTAVAGFVGVEHNRYADLSQYEKMVIRGSGEGLRILANRLVAHGPWKQITVRFNDDDPYWDEELQSIVLPLSELQETVTNEGVERVDDFVHLNALKIDWSGRVNVSAVYLIPSAEALDIETVDSNRQVKDDGHWYSLYGQKVLCPTRGIYIHDGKKVYVQ